MCSSDLLRGNHDAPSSFVGGTAVGTDGLALPGVETVDAFERRVIEIGDLALTGYQIIGHVVAHRGGHALHTAFAAQMLQERDAWELVEPPVDADFEDAPVVLPVKDQRRATV